MKILLINPPVRNYMFNSGLGYIAACLQAEGHEVNVLDIDVCRYLKEIVEQKLQNYDFEAIGITGMITTYPYVKWLASIIKDQYQVPIVVGGTGATSIPKLYLEKTDIDVVVIGEGENTSRELFEALEDSRDLENINGIWFKKDGKIFPTSPRKLIGNLNVIPHPAWDLFRMDIYIRKGFHPVSLRRQMNISTTRGCPYKCVYCYHCFQGHKPRFRSPNSIINEMKILREKYKIKYIGFADDLFMLSKKRVFDFCKELKESNLNIKWGTSGRVNLIDEKLLEMMASSGCVYLGYGIESGNQTILNNMDKRATVNEAKKAINLTRKAGIQVGTSFMIGMVGETKKTLRETIEFIKDMNIDFKGFFFTTPYPGTRLWDYAKEKGLIPDDEALIVKYGEMTQKLLVNFTDFTNEELISLKASAEKEIKKAYFRRHKLTILIKRIKLFKNLIRSAVNYYRNFGIKRFFKKLLEKLSP